MRCLGVLAASVLIAALIGCGPGKELPDEGPKAGPAGEPPADALGKAPAVSDPAAKAILERAVKAITQGDSTRLTKAKISKTFYRGEVHFPNSPAPTEATLKWEVVWPDRALTIYEFKNAPVLNITFRMFGQLGWMTKDTVPQTNNPAEVEKVIRTRLVGEHGLILGITLADPRVIAFDPVKAQTGPAGTAVKIALPDAPILRVTFDDQSGLPVRLEYNPIEFSQRVPKVLTMSEHKPQDGMLLPTVLELQQMGLPAEKWTLEKWEFPEKIDEARFDAPK